MMSASQKNPFLNYKIESFLGFGSFGGVFKVKSKLLKKQIALKIIEANPSREEKVRRELEIPLQISHKNLVKVYGYSEGKVTSSELREALGNVKAGGFLELALDSIWEITLFFVDMELCGESLKEWLKMKHDVSQQTVQQHQLSIVLDIVEGIKYLHDKRIMHRDLRPDNVVFVGEGFQLPMKICDFGQVRIIQEDMTSRDVLTSMLGREEYRSPEAWNNAYSFQSDLYSLGLMIWEVMQLLPSEEVSTYFGNLVDDGKEELIRPTPLIKDFPYWVSILTKKDAKKRLQSADQIKFILREVTVSSTQEFEEALKNCGRGWIIYLSEGEFRGHFQLNKDNVEIRGRGDKTILKGSDDKKFVLDLQGEDIKCSGFVIDESTRSGVCGIIFKGRRGHLSELEISGCETGIIISRESNSVKIENILLSSNRTGININNANRVEVISTSFSQCDCGIKIQDLVGAKNPDAREERDNFSGQKIILKISDVCIETDSRSGQTAVGICVSKCQKGVIQLDDVRCSGFLYGNLAGLVVEDFTSCTISQTNCHWGEEEEEG